MTSQQIDVDVTLEVQTSDEFKNFDETKHVEVLQRADEIFGNIVIKVEAPAHPLGRNHCVWKYKGESHSICCDYDSKLIPNKYYFAKDLVFINVSYNNCKPYLVITNVNDNVEFISWL